MPESTTLLAVLETGFLLGLILTRSVKNWAARVGLVDRPDGRRKLQQAPVPVAGGVAVFLAATLTLTGLALISPGVAQPLFQHGRTAGALLASALLITLLGLADDWLVLRPFVKLLGQTGAVLVFVLGGDAVIQTLSLFGWQFELGRLAVPFTVFWLLACVNALNLIDGMDGLLGTVGGIALLSLAAIAALAGQSFAVVVALALAGAVFGFLVWNLPPASVYMGDAGSMLIGLVVGAVSIPASLKGPATVALAAPLAILVLPMFDTTAAIVRRKLTGRSFASPDREHLHHALLARGWTVQRALVLVAVLGLIAAGGALVATALHNDLYAVISAGGVVVGLVAGNLFGRTELGLIRAYLRDRLRGRPAGATEPTASSAAPAPPVPPFGQDLLVPAADPGQ